MNSDLGTKAGDWYTSLRFGIKRFTIEEEVDKAVDITCKQVNKLRELNLL